MIKIENIETFNWEGAFRGLRNPMNSWAKSDSAYKYESQRYHKNMFVIGDEDMKLAKRMVKAGSDERKFLRQIFVSMDITAPDYFFRELSTYKVGTVENSTSFMHKGISKPFEIEDFSHEHITKKTELHNMIFHLNCLRDKYLAEKDNAIKKDIWYEILQQVPWSYNYKRTYTCNYENLLNMYHARKNHKLDEWKEFCRIIETLPYAKELICLEKNKNA